MTPSPRTTEALSVRGVSKSFGATQALSPLDLDVHAGQIHALLGENGSGKSTLIKVLSGYHRPDTGEVLVAGERLVPGSPASSAALGCRFVHQDLGLVLTETVVDNLYAGTGYPTRFGTIDGRAARRAAEADLARVGVDLDPRRVAGSLSPAEQTAVAVARALRPGTGSPARLLVLDEPTARLPEREVEDLLRIVRTTAASGVGVIYVSHRIDEVLEVAEVATVLRDGRTVATREIAGLSRGGLVNLLVGDELELLSTSDVVPAPGAPTVLTVEGLEADQLRRISFGVGSGEVVGFCGITGSGRESVLSTLFGGSTRHGGTVRVGDRALPPGRPDLSIAAGVAYLPPDRKLTGAVMEATARENLVLADLGRHWRWPMISRRRERTETAYWFDRFDVRPRLGMEQPLSTFSGGNQQKVLFGKWLRLGARVLLLDEPTQGVDIATKVALHKEILAAAEAGTAVVVSSSDTAELLSVCHRVLVLNEGRIVAEVTGAERTVKNLSRLALGAPEEVAR